MLLRIMEEERKKKELEEKHKEAQMLKELQNQQ